MVLKANSKCCHSSKSDKTGKSGMEILKRDIVLTSKNELVMSELQSIQFFKSIGDAAKSKAHMEAEKELWLR